MKKTIQVTQEVEVTVDETKFTPEFLTAFRDVFYNLDDVDEHIQNLGEAYLRGIVSSELDFLEGYGKLSNFGVKFNNKNVEVETLD